MHSLQYTPVLDKKHIYNWAILYCNFTADKKIDRPVHEKNYCVTYIQFLPDNYSHVLKGKLYSMIQAILWLLMVKRSSFYIQILSLSQLVCVTGDLVSLSQLRPVLLREFTTYDQCCVNYRKVPLEQKYRYPSKKFLWWKFK